MTACEGAASGRRDDPGASSALPGGTTSRLILLSAAVGVGGLYVFLQTYFLVPRNTDFFFGTFSRCFQDPRIALPERSDGGYEESRRLLVRCQQPAFVDQAQWVGLGFLLLCGASLAWYATHPWWVTRRRCARLPAVPSLRARSLARFPRRDDPHERDMAEYLDHLCHAVGVHPAPVWLLDTSARTASGLAFGLPRRRYVIIDAPLVPYFATDRDLFRLVLAHELAHLRHHDVDKTYLAFGIWWAFLTVAVLPFGVLTVYHAASGGPPALPPGIVPYLVDVPHALGLMAALTLLVQLVRNAVLRARELHADALAAAHGVVDGAAVVRRALLPEPAAPGRGPVRRALSGLVRRLGYWPTPATRRRVLLDPTLLTRPTVGEMLGAGIVAGVFTASADTVLDTLFRLLWGKLNTRSGDLTVGCAIGAGLTGVLAAAVWRAVAVSDRAPGPPRAAVVWALPAGLVGGYLVGAGLPLLTDGTALPATGLETQGFAWLLPAGPVLLAGAACVTVWLVSVARGLLPHARGRGPLYAVVATSVVSFAPWFAVWYSLRRDHASAAFRPVAGDAPDVGSSIGWYAALARWTGSTWPPLTVQGRLPLALVGLSLIWLVPLALALLAGRAHEPEGGARSPLRRLLLAGRAYASGADLRPRLQKALFAGLVAGGAVAAAGLALPFLARSALPSAVLHYSGTRQDAGFPDVYWHTYVALAGLAQGAAALWISARARGLRPVLVLAGTAVTALVSAVGRAPAFAVAECTGLFGAPGHRCSVPFDPEVFAQDLRTITLRGLLLVIPAALLGAGMGALAGRRPALRQGTARTAGGRREPAWAPGTVLAVLVVLAVADLAAVVLALPADHAVWRVWLRG
ncbi:M48 family metalloprotease [Streptomyces sp. CC224B]|uniref:M48 family metalloprotease n=1 Tax=Streptomyces sp. CC224B TaxID=3044571 RepID=UPI0024A91C35|nr:M48 family metalloprotease [Streptomyces sp. CC224B]